jgi:hypothetical protein
MRHQKKQLDLFMNPTQPRRPWISRNTHSAIVQARLRGHRVLCAGHEHVFDGHLVDHRTLRTLLSVALIDDAPFQVREG